MFVFGGQYPTVAKIAGVLGTVFLLVGIGCHILCLATPYFFILPNNAAGTVVNGHTPGLENYTFGINYGLWMICVNAEPSFHDKCFPIKNNSSAIRDYLKTNSSAIRDYLKTNSSATEVNLPEWLVAPRVLSLVGLLLASGAVFSLIAFVCTNVEKLPNVFLACAAVSSIVGGIIILSSDISFAAEKTIVFYGDNPKEPYLFPKGITEDQKARLIQQYNNNFISGWSFILDLISGALCITVGPVFVFVIIKLQWAKEHLDKQWLKKHAPSSHGNVQMTSL